MGRIRLKFLVVFIFLFLSLSVSFADTAQFIYNNTVSSSDFDVKPKIGSVFKDEEGNVLIVKKVLQQEIKNDEEKAEGEENAESTEKVFKDIIVFDKYYTKGDGVKLGSKLTKRSNLYKVNVVGSLSFAFVDFSLTTVIYPFEPILIGGLTYSKAGNSAFVLGGARVTVPLSNFFSSVKFTLIEDGRLEGFVAPGVRFSSYGTEFACAYGVSFKHNLGMFTWGLHGLWLSGEWGVGSISPGVSIGVSI